MSNTPVNKIVELAERIVIDYANLSGRETANRPEFRKRVLKHLTEHENLVREDERERIGKIIENFELSEDQQKSCDWAEHINRIDLLQIIWSLPPNPTPEQGEE